MFETKRLHPAAIIFNLIKTVREFLFAIILGFITFRDESLVYFVLIVAGLLVIFITGNVLTWYRYTYRVEDNELRIEYGVFIRKKRYISKNRIQSIDLTSGVIHRILKLTKVQIETAGTGMSAEASLSAVKLAEGEALRQELKTGRTQQADKGDIAEESAEPIYPSDTICFKRLFIAGTTSGGIGVIMALAVAAFSELEQFIPDSFYDNTVEWVIGLGFIFMIVLTVFLLLLLWLLGIAGTMIKYGNFTITKNDQELLITRGLLEKKQLTIPLRRIQAVGIQESMIRQPLGYVTVFAEIAGGSMDKGEDFSSILFPIMKRDEVEEFLGTFLPEYSGIQSELTPLPKRARKFYLMRSMIPFLLIVAAVGIFFPTFIWAPLILLLVGGLVLGWLRHKDGGFSLEGTRLTIRHRVLSRNTIMMYHKRIQAFEKKQHKLQKVQQMASMRLSIVGKMGAGTHFTIKDLEETHTDELSDWYSLRSQGSN
ncbi:putative membrane protein [Lentibacillus halodurans]|uniref:Putative membrane protein n=1 Tax=Lentibacillus halodurans TaxID=237679 RepID=A0A1I1AR37_9BACI|nr:PH domain-containing protein [Lentibacillus halodurans]SFB38810.1 putative membrane protein [Lentibacillus halodurans]